MILRASIALLVGACIAVLIALTGAWIWSGALAAATGHPTFPGSLALCAGGLGALAVGWRLKRLPPPSRPKTGVDWLVLGLYLLFAARSFLWLIFERGDDIAFLNSNNLGDLSLHITYIQSLARDLVFWPDNPILAGTPLHYPFGTDFFNALLVQAGVPLERGLVWTGLLGALLTGVALWRWGRSFAVIGFLCNGGFAALPFFLTGVIHDYQTTEAWKSIPLALFVTQRGLLYAIPVGLLLLWSWKTRLLEATTPSGKNAPLPLWLELLLYSTLPLFHLHTFLFLSLMLGSWALAGTVGVAGAARWSRTLTANRLLARRSFQLVALAFLPATLLVFLVAGYGSAKNSLHWKAGWMQAESGYSPLFFWFFNFGLWPVVALLLLLWLFRMARQAKNPEDRLEARRNLLLVVPALAIFLLGCFLMFAIWEWDNTKLFLWSYLVLLLPLRDLLRRMPVPVQALAWCGLFFSGFISLLGGLGLSENRGNGYALARRSELAQIRQSLQSVHLPRGARIAFTPTYNHPLFLLGYHGIAGYEGHLYSHGLDYKATYRNLEHLLKGTPGWDEAAHALGVTWLFWGAKEENAYGSAPQLWRSHAEPVASSRSGTLYYLKKHASEALPAPLSAEPPVRSEPR